MNDDCWFCHDERRLDRPAGPWLVDDGTWRAAHTPPAYAIAGTVVLESVRHVLDQAEMDPAERATLAAVTGRLVAAIRETTGCDRVYQWASMAGHPHFHLWLLPWWQESALQGPAYLAAMTSEGSGCTPAAAQASAVRLRDALARQTP